MTLAQKTRRDSDLLEERMSCLLRNRQLELPKEMLELIPEDDEDAEEEKPIQLKAPIKVNSKPPTRKSTASAASVKKGNKSASKPSSMSAMLKRNLTANDDFSQSLANKSQDEINFEREDSQIKPMIGSARSSKDSICRDTAKSAKAKNRVQKTH